MSKRPLLREMIDPSCLASLLVRMEEMITTILMVGCGAYCKQGKQFSNFCLGEKVKRTQRDSNPRHSVPKTDALSTELWVQMMDVPIGE